MPTQPVFTPQLSPEGQQAAIEEAQKNAIEKAEAQRDSLEKSRAGMQDAIRNKKNKEEEAGNLLQRSNSAPDLSSINEKMRGLHDESKVLNPAGYSVETIKKAKDNPELMKRLGSKSEKGDWIKDGESKYDRRGLRTAVTNLPKIERNKADRTSMLGSIDKKTELKAQSDQAYESLPGLQAKIEEATAKFNKEQASPDRLSPKQREIAPGIRSQAEEDQALESIKPDFMSKSVVTKGKDGKTTSRRATAKDVAKTPEEFRSLTQQENTYNSAKMNIAYERSSKSKQDAEKARQEAEFIKQNPEVASLQKKQAQERTSLAQGFSRKDEKGNATTGIRMGEENGYAKEEVGQFKVESAGLKAKHDVEMQQAMIKAKNSRFAGAVLPQQLPSGQPAQQLPPGQPTQPVISANIPPASGQPAVQPQPIISNQPVSSTSAQPSPQLNPVVDIPSSPVNVSEKSQKIMLLEKQAAAISTYKKSRSTNEAHNEAYKNMKGADGKKYDAQRKIENFDADMKIIDDELQSVGSNNKSKNGMTKEELLYSRDSMTKDKNKAVADLPGLKEDSDKKSMLYKKAQQEMLSPKQREIASEIRSQSEEDQALESIKPDFMNKSVVTKGKDGKTTSRRATAKDVAKTPEEFRSLTQQENTYNSAKMNIAYERSSKSKQDAEKARQEAEFIKQNPEVASLQKKQAQERTSLAQGFSRKDEKGNATTGIRMGEENGYAKEEVAKFKVESAGLTAKHDVEMKEVMTRAKGGLSSATGLSQQAMMGQSVQPGSPAVTPSKNSPQWMQDSLNGKSGVKSSGDLRTSRLGASPNSPQWMQDSLNGKSSVVSSDLRTPRLAVGAEKTTQQAVTEKLIKPQIDQKQNDSVKPNQQQDPTQVISSILTTVNQIAAELQNQVNPTATDGGQSVASGGSGSVSVSAPVNLSINSTAGENKTEVANVADKIKTDLTAFLSSPEFLDRVTTIAKNATGNPQPPKAIV